MVLAHQITCILGVAELVTCEATQRKASAKRPIVHLEEVAVTELLKNREGTRLTRGQSALFATKVSLAKKNIPENLISSHKPVPLVKVPLHTRTKETVRTKTFKQNPQ